MAWASKKAPPHYKFQRGWASGYTEYRYGSKAKKPTLPQVFKGDARKQAINRIMDALSDWRSSPFEREGTVHHAIRTALCLEGYAWSVSDHEAVALVAEAFGRIGCKRPDYEEAQRWHVEPQENCRNCGLLLMGAVRNGSRIMYCSTECAAVAWRDVKTLKSDDKTYSAIYRAVERFKFEPVPCSHCSRSFRPRHGDQRLCSVECRQAVSRTIDEFTCQHCNQLFRPKSIVRLPRFCSSECFWTNTRAQRHMRKCELCGVDFTGTQGTRVAIYCCNSHGKMASKIRKRIQATLEAGRIYTPAGQYLDYASRILEAIQTEKASQPQTRPLELVSVRLVTPAMVDGWFHVAA